VWIVYGPLSARTLWLTVLGLLAFAPAVLFAGIFYERFRFSVITKQAVFSFCGGILVIPPILLLAEPLFHLTMDLRRNAFTAAFVDAFVMSASIEEFFKYIVVRKILFQSHVADCGGVLLYSLAAGAGFAAAENVKYAMNVAPEVVLKQTSLRAVLPVPMHCCAGLMVGIQMAKRKFLGADMSLGTTLSGPVLLHFSFNFVQFFAIYSSPWDPRRYEIVAWCLSLACLLAGMVVARIMWLPLNDVCVVDVRAALRDGCIDAPGSQCLAWVGPADAPCVATPAVCSRCSSNVFAHARCPSVCPHCGEGVPSSAVAGAPAV